MKKAAFNLDNYRFNSVAIDLKNSPSDDEPICIDFLPSGIFDAELKSFELSIVFFAFDEQKGKNECFVKTECTSVFSFDGVDSFEEIPPYFFKNSIAIVFPYIRAFVSSITVQANIKPPLILPTMNLGSLETVLKENSVLK